MDIKDALGKLDPQNNDHWTGDGLPLVQAVSDLVGKDVSRKEVTDALPGFSRALAIKNATGTQVASQVVNTPTTSEQAAQSQSATPTQATENGDNGAPKDEDQVQQTKSDEMEDGSGDADVDLSLADVLQQAQKTLETKRKEKAEADAALKEAEKAHDIALVAYEESIATNNSQPLAIQQYLQSQVKAAEEKKARIDIITASGLDLNTLTESLKGSPLDEAMRNKRK
jgi:hypothetical protein